MRIVLTVTLLVLFTGCSPRQYGQTIITPAGARIACSVYSEVAGIAYCELYPGQLGYKGPAKDIKIITEATQCKKNP